MILFRYADAEEVARQAARLVLEAAVDAVERFGRFNVALSGGRTPLRVFECLSHGETQLPEEVVTRMHLFWGDERSVPQNNRDSNVGAAIRALIEPLGFPRENVHAPNGGSRNLEREAREYDLEIKRNVRLGANGQPAFDLVLLGMGADGHTASLFPGTPALDETVRAFVANDVPQLSTRRMTVTFGVLNAATHVVILVTGAEKADALAEVFMDYASDAPPRHPIGRVRGNGENILWLADEAALSKFTPEMLRYHQLQEAD